MAAGAKFVPNPSLPLIVNRMVEPHTRSTTEKVADLARTLAPVLTGAFAASIDTDFGSGRYPGEVIGRVVSNIRYATFLEFGTSDTEAFATFRVAAEGTSL